MLFLNAAVILISFVLTYQASEFLRGGSRHIFKYLAD